MRRREGLYFVRLLLVSLALVLTAVLLQVRGEMNLRLENLKRVAYQISIARDVRVAASMDEAKQRLDTSMKPSIVLRSGRSP